jgi:hypothetical protein
VQAPLGVEVVEERAEVLRDPVVAVQEDECACRLALRRPFEVPQAQKRPS